jgi:hypothetical protein
MGKWNLGSSALRITGADLGTSNKNFILRLPHGGPDLETLKKNSFLLSTYGESDWGKLASEGKRAQTGDMGQLGSLPRCSVRRRHLGLRKYPESVSCVLFHEPVGGLDATRVEWWSE